VQQDRVQSRAVDVVLTLVEGAVADPHGRGRSRTRARTRRRRRRCPRCIRPCARARGRIVVERGRVWGLIGRDLPRRDEGVRAGLVLARDRHVGGEEREADVAGLPVEQRCRTRSGSRSAARTASRSSRRGRRAHPCGSWSGRRSRRSAGTGTAPRRSARGWGWPAPRPRSPVWLRCLCAPSRGGLGHGGCSVRGDVAVITRSG
jgi:hypothetical protein